MATNELDMRQWRRSSLLNDHQLDADVDDAEQLFLKLAAGELERSELIDRITANLIEMDT